MMANDAGSGVGSLHVPADAGCSDHMASWAIPRSQLIPRSTSPEPGWGDPQASTALGGHAGLNHGDG